MRRSILDPKHRRRLGPPPSTPVGKREPVEEQVTVRGEPASQTKNIRTPAPVKTATPPQRVGVPDKARAEKGMTLNLLLRKQPRYMHNSAEDIVIRSLKPAKTKGGLPAIIGTARDIKTKPIRIHKFQVIGLDKAKSAMVTQKRIKVSCDCVTGDTRVLTSDGWKTIFDIAEEFNPRILPFEYIVNGKPVRGTAPYFKGKKPVWEIVASNGRKLKATADHKILVYANSSGTKRVWRKLKNIRVGDRLHVDCFDLPEVDTLSEKYLVGFFLGVIMGDGTVNTNHNADLHLCGKKTALLDLLAKAGVVEKFSKVGRDVRVTFNHRAIELLRRHKFKNKESVEISHPETVIGYLAGLISTDGTITKTLTITGDQKYLEQAQEMCQGLGLGLVTLHKFASRGEETNYGVRSKDLFGLRFGANDILKLRGRLLLTDYNKVRFDRLVSKLKGLRTRTAVTVQSIAYAGRQNVYDITVPGPARFNANGFTVHNCEFFMYYSEYALWTWGAANIRYSNGQPAVVRNPSNYPILCKHLVRVLMEIKQHNL